MSRAVIANSLPGAQVTASAVVPASWVIVTVA
jgi:hypothetical protein